MRIIEDVYTARTKVLKRIPPRTVDLPDAMKERIAGVFGEGLSAEETVTRIVEDVRTRGDEALYEYVRKLDGVGMEHLEVSPDTRASARGDVEAELLDSLAFAAGRIGDFHRRQMDSLPVGETWLADGVGQVLAPIELVGVYAPGGTASYPSTVLMTAIPARVAGVKEVLLVTPPRQDGNIPPLTLAAAEIAGVDRVFAMGGAAAIAALAFGTESIPKVDKICGPGNIFVMLAKKYVMGTVGIDGLHGPTETLVLADDSADPRFCAADLIAQAEHDEMSSAVMVTTSKVLADEVNKEIERQLDGLSRGDIAGKALEQRGAIVVAGNMEEAIELANEYAPEHLCLLIRNPDEVAPRLHCCGGIFVGETSPEVLGDYVAGPSHVMPTGGTARFSSPLNILDFLKVTSLVALDGRQFGALSAHAVNIAEAEGLTAHVEAIRKRQG